MVKTFYGRLHFNLAQLGTSAHRRRSSCGGAPLDGPRRRDSAGRRELAPPSLSVLRMRPTSSRIMWRHVHIARSSAARRRSRGYMRQLVVDRSAPTVGHESVVGVEHWIGAGPEFMQTVLLLTNVTIHEGPVRKFCERSASRSSGSSIHNSRWASAR